MLPIPQVVAASTIESRESLPSFLYLGTEAEADAAAFTLPWSESGPDFAVGEHARRQAADVPDRTISAAKSWLCHSRIDRKQDILPWGSDGPKVSPVEASRRYLEHVVSAWNAAHPDAPAAGQHVVLTVPASFDAAARQSTREAALSGGVALAIVGDNVCHWLCQCF